MNVFKSLILARPVKTQLDFGHNENVVIKDINFGVKKNNGIAIKANTFISLVKIDPETQEIKAQSEISFWNLDPSKDFVNDNFISQFTNLYAIVSALGGNEEDFEASVLGVLEGETESETLKFLKTKDNAKVVQTAMIEAFKTQVEDKIGITNPILLKCKMIVNKAGYLEPGPEVNWILPMTSSESLPKLSSREKFTQKESLKNVTKKAKPDVTGAAPDATPDTAGEEKTVSSDTLLAL